MSEFELIDLAKAKEMSEADLQEAISIRVKYLRDTLGMDRFEAANFASSLLNLGFALGTIFEKRRSEKIRSN